VLRLRLVVLGFASCLGSLLILSGCGGGGSTTSSSSSSTGTGSGGSSTSNPAPAITSFTPASIVAGSPAQTLTISGTGFISASAVGINGSALTTTYSSGSSLQVAVPASAIAADGTLKVTVTNPSPGGGTSPAQNYVITVPTPAVTGISPQSVTQGTAATITITGTGFEANSVAQWNGSSRPTTYVNSTTLQMALSAADLQNFGTGSISVANPGLPPTTPVELLVISNMPTIVSVSPNSVPAYTGTNPQQIFINGSGFAPNATVQANGQPVPVVNQSVTSITVTLPASDFSTPGSISLVVSNPGSPVVSSNAGILTVTAPPGPAFTVFPNYAPAGSPDTTITITGTGFFPDSVVSWNNTPLATSYVNSTSITAVIPAALLAGFAQANISVSTPENTGPNALPQPFDTFLSLPINDIVYNTVDGYIYASIPGSAAGGMGNSIVAIDPATGILAKTIAIGSEPNRLALSTDGTQLFVGLNGAGAVRQINLTTGTAGQQFSLGGGPGIYNPPYTAVSLAAVPGQANSVAVCGSNGIVTIFDSGVARANTSSGLETSFNANVGSLAFGSSASTLYVASQTIGGYLYQFTVDATGVTASKQLATNAGGNSLQYDNGRLYFSSGLVFDATSGNQLGQFSTTSSFSTTPTAASGPIFSDSTLNLAWIVPSNFNGSSQILSFDETTFDPVTNISLTGVGASTNQISSSPQDLIRWGQNGLAFHTANQLYVIQGPIVKDITNSPADLALAVQAPATGVTGSSVTYTLQVQNTGPNPAQGVALTATVPQSVIFGSITPTQGLCTGAGVFYCDLGTIASGSSASVTITVTPTVSGAVETTANVSSVSYDPVPTNNNASGSTTVTGSLFSPAPVVTQLSPMLIQAGTGTFTLTVDGAGFTSASTVLWNGTALPTTLLSGGQLTATVNSSLIQQLGWSLVSVSSAGPGGGTSTALPLSIYQLLNVPASAMSFDPFTRKLYAVLPSTSTPLAGNSIVAIDPGSGAIGTPIMVGSEPNLLSETSDGDYLYIGLSGAQSLGRFNLLTQSLDFTVTLPNNATFPSGNAAAIAIATVPGSDTSLAVENNSFNGISILDISGGTATYRQNSSSAYSGDNPVFADSTHFYAFDSDTTGAEFYRYSIDSTGVHLIDGTTLNGFGGFGGGFALDDGLVFGTGGGIVNPATTPPSQIAVLPFGEGPFGTGLVGGGVVPYAEESKSFNVAVNDAGTALSYLDRFNTQTFTLEQQIQFPTAAVANVPGTRWGQDGLAYIIPGANSSATPNQQIFLIQGPFVLPAEAVSNAAPTVSTTDHNTITAGSGNAYVNITGTGFLPGATALWNGSSRTTTYVSGTQLTVAIPASDVQSAASISLSVANPGSTASGAITITVQ
jgi:uncharacterized repeat protein (TIGR01451 family)